MAVANKSKKSYKYVEVTSLIGHATKFVKQVENYVTDNKTRYSSTVQKIEQVIFSLLFAINQLCDHLELNYHLEVVSEEGERLTREFERPAENPLDAQNRALDRLMEALDEYGRKQVEDQAYFLEFIVQLMSKKERDEMIAAIPENCRRYNRSITPTVGESAEKPKRGPGRPKKVKEGLESPDKVVEDVNTSKEVVEEEEPNFDTPAEDKHVSPNKEEKKAYIQDMGIEINHRLDVVRELDSLDEEDGQSPFLLDDVKMFAKYIAIWWDSAILRRRNINPKFTYQPSMIPGWIAGFAHFAGKTIEDAEKEYKKRNGNMLEIKLTDRWSTFDTRFNEWMAEIREDSTNRWAVPLEVHSITKGDALNMYTLTGLNILSKYCDFVQDRENLTRVKLNKLLERRGLAPVSRSEKLSFTKEDERSSILETAKSGIYSSMGEQKFPGLGRELLRSEWKAHTSEYLALGRLRAKLNCTPNSPIDYKFEGLGANYLNNPLEYMSDVCKQMYGGNGGHERLMRYANSCLNNVKNQARSQSRYDYIMRGITKSEKEYIQKFETENNWNR